MFLPDPFKPAKKRQTPEDHVTANIVLNAMTIVACLTLTILLYTILGFRDDTHPLIYATAGLLIAMACWHIQTLWRTILLRKHFKKSKPRDNSPGEVSTSNVEMLEEPDLSDLVPASVTDHTTRQLKQDKQPVLSEPKH